MIKKTIHILITLLIMLATSGLLIRIVDATVQIDDDLGILVLLLILTNIIIGAVSYKLYKSLVTGAEKRRRSGD